MTSSTLTSSIPSLTKLSMPIILILTLTSWFQMVTMVTSQQQSLPRSPSPSSTTFTLGSSGEVSSASSSRHGHRVTDDTMTAAGGDGGGEYDTYFSDWSSLASRPTQPTCVDIPKNMTLCHNIGYHKMRLPNLLDHDTLDEALHQSQPWISLLNINCHLDTQLFLCSLFSPVCLDRPIYPCRSLCDKVKSGCEGRMSTYGFPWPDMFRCDKFPLDNDMCITAQSTNPQSSTDTSACSACGQIQTYENILDNFCRADFALKTKIKKVQNSRIVCKKSKIYKRSKNLDDKDGRALRRPKFEMENMDGCCNGIGKNSKAHYLIMGQKLDNNLVPTLIMEWSTDSSAFKKAVKRFKGLDCSNPKIVSESMVVSVDGARKQDSPFNSNNNKKGSNNSNNQKKGNTGRNSRKTRGGGGKQNGNKDSLFSTSNANVTIIGGYKLPDASKS